MTINERGKDAPPASPKWVNSLESYSFSQVTVFVGAVCFLAIWLPCFFFLPAGPFELLPSFDSLMLLYEGAWMGCIAGSVLAMAAVGAGLFPDGLPRGVVIAASCVFVVGYLPVPASALGLVFSGSVVVAFGCLFGLSLVVVATCWSLRVRSGDFRKLLIGVAGAGLCAVLINLLLSHLPPLPFAAILMFLLVGAVVPLVCCERRGIAFPRYDASSALEGRFSNEAAEAGVERVPDNDALGVEHAADSRNGRRSVMDLFFMLGTSTAGFMLFAILSQMRQGAFQSDIISSTSLGLLIAAVLIVLLMSLFRSRFSLPHVFWVLFPSVAGVLLVLDSFPVKTFVMNAGSMGVFVFCAMLGLFSLAFLVKVAARGEYSPLLVVGVSLLCFAAASWLGDTLSGLGFDGDQLGGAMLVVSTVYFVFLLISPVIQLWRVVRGGEKETEQAARPLEGDALDGRRKRSNEEEMLQRRCDELAASYGLTAREREVLGLASCGYTSTYIAKELFVSDNTVRSHLKGIYRKLGVSSKSELIDIVRS